MNYLCSTLRTLDALRASRDEMAALADAPGGCDGIVQHPDWIAYEVESRDDGTTPHVIVVRDGAGRMVGYAPFLAIRHTARLDLGGRRVNVYRGEALRLLGAGIVATAAERSTATLAIIRQLHGDIDVRVMRIQESPLPNAFAEALGKGEDMRLVSANLLEQVQWTIEGQASSEAWLAQMDKKRRTDLTQRVGRAYRKLGGDAALHVFDTPEAMPEYCRLMNELYPRTWHHDDLPIHWDHPLRVALFQRLAATGHIVGHLVLRDGQPLAYVHGYRVAGTYLVDDLGYDEAIAKVGIGSVAVFQAIKALLDRFPGENVSFGYGDNQYKRLLATHSQPCGSLYVVRSTRATAGFHMYAPVRWLYRGLHRVREDMRSRKRGQAATSPVTR